jgi:hypothetical protein
MLSFKSYLQEAPIDKWDVSWKKNYIDHIITSDLYILVTPEMVRNILGDIKIESFHGTTMNGLKQMKAIQHTRKTVSSFTKVSDPDSIAERIFSGNYKENVKRYDVICKLYGSLVIGNTFDIMSVPDEKGLRGSNIGDELPEYWESKSNFLGGLFDEFFNNVPEKYETEILACQKYDSYYYSYYALVNLHYITRDNNLKRFIKAFFASIQHKFYFFCRDVVIDNKELFKEQFREKVLKRQNYSYNEILISNFSIEEILIISYDSSRIDDIIEGIQRLGFGNKVVNYKEWMKATYNFVNLSDESWTKCPNNIGLMISHFINFDINNGPEE